MRPRALIAFACLTISLLACKGSSKARDEQTAKVRSMIEATRARAKNRSAAMVHAVLAAHPKSAADESQPCATHVPPPPDGAGFPLLRPTDAIVDQALGPTARSLEADLVELEKAAALDPPPDDLLARAERVCSDERFHWELVLVADAYVPPTAKPADGAFATGRIQGRAYLYDYAATKVTCLASVDAVSSPRMSAKSTPAEWTNDLEGEAFRQGAASLHPASASP